MKTFPRAVVFLAILGLLLVACGGGESEPSPTSPPGDTHSLTPGPSGPTVSSATPPGVRLPQDDAPHPGANTEWWYYNGSLRTADGKEFGFHYVVFAFNLPFLPATHVSQLSITDHQTSAYVTGQRQVPIGPRTAGGAGFSFDIDGWTMSGLDGRDRIVASAGDYAFDLSLNSEKPAVLHSGNGLVDLGPAGESYYYSRTRMAASGTLTLQGEEAPVSGVAWFDHQWGSFAGMAVGWDWFSLRFDDRREAMLYVLRDDDGTPLRAFGTFVAEDGRQEALDQSDFTLRATGTWVSPVSGAEYPMGWTLEIPSHSMGIVLRPIIEESEFDATATTRNYYWEGEVLLSGTHTGRGYVELVGYAPTDLSSLDTQP